MKILIVAHIGQTLGHLVRALAIADALTDVGVRPEIVSGPDGKWAIEQSSVPYRHHVIDWTWSHNEIRPTTPTEDYADQVIASVKQLLALLDDQRPDLVIGCPGVFTSQAARSRHIPHISILHGPYLSPIIRLENATAVERSAIDFATAIACNGSFDRLFDQLASNLGLPQLSYLAYLETESIIVPQPGLVLPSLPNLQTTEFIRASIGPAPPARELERLAGACYVTFGSGNPCDLEEILRVADRVFDQVVVTTGFIPTGPVPKNVLEYPFIASSALAGRVSAVISHGGIGTVGTFAEHRTPQLIIPTEIDQATMAVHGPRLGVAEQYGLEAWASAPRLGRRLPTLDGNALEQKVRALRTELPREPVVTSDGARAIAARAVRYSG